VHDREGDTTLCPTCATKVIERDWYEILATRMKPGGTCAQCNTQIAGRFGAQAGNWGRRRMRVVMNQQ